MVEKMLKSLESAINALSGMYKGFSEKNDYGRRGFLKAGAAIGTGVLAACCDSGGGSGGGGGDDPTPNPGDTTAPGTIQDIYAYASSQKGESVFVEFTQPGDDGFNSLPKASYLEIRVSDSPIATEEHWNNAVSMAVLFEDEFGGGGSYFTKEFDLSQIQAVVDAGLNSGDLYFSARAYDEANNEGKLSIPENPGEDHAYIPSKAEFYVDKWLSSDGFLLNYYEVVPLIQGEGSIPSYSRELAEQLVTCSGPTFPGTVIDLEDGLLTATNGLFNPTDEELWDDQKPFLWNPSTHRVRTYYEPSGNAIDYNNLSDLTMSNIHSIVREFLIKYVKEHEDDIYESLYSDFNPGWQI